ncbi:MAG: cysteine-rich small domain-containing protein [Nitrospirota bacterium]|jgi:Zn-finger protein
MGKERMLIEAGERSGEAARGASSRFFENRGCEYFPCHDMEGRRMNCLFCYCPLYHSGCPGEAEFILLGGGEVKDCSRCDFPHRPENYDAVVELLLEMFRQGA